MRAASTTCLPCLTVLLTLATTLLGPAVLSAAEILQLTHDARNHSLDNNDNFSPDDQWLVYDTRTTDGGIGAGRTIEKVHVRSAESQVIYQAPNPDEFGPGCGAASYHPTQNQVVFIHGLLNHSEQQPYHFWRRFGMLIDESRPNQPVWTDARDVQPPYTPGALRGGTHRHEFSGDGLWLGYTYNDQIMAERGESFNLRTIGVTRLDQPVMIDGTPDGSNFHGAGTSALVVRVTPDPRPGSDEISHAARDSWIGQHGYRRPGGRMQRARAFLGTVYTLDGRDVPELFVVDVPDDLTAAGVSGPLEGTDEMMPMPPLGAVQRRLSHTTDQPYPGFSGNVRSSPDGSTLACLGKDDQGIDQVVLASPLDGHPRPFTSFDTPVQSDVRWHPQGSHICFVHNDAVVVANVRTGECRPLTETTPDSPPFALVWSRHGNIIAWNRTLPTADGTDEFIQIFAAHLQPADLPGTPAR